MAMLSEVRKVPGLERRAETAPLQFGDDWPGVFIRGDDAMTFASVMRRAAEKFGEDTPWDIFDKHALKRLVLVLDSSQVRP